MTPAARRRHLGRGARAEWLALAFLVLKGWRPLARRWRAPGGEIDLVMARGRVVIFVEVKARALIDDAATSVTGEKTPPPRPRHPRLEGPQPLDGGRGGRSGSTRCSWAGGGGRGMSLG